MLVNNDSLFLVIEGLDGSGKTSVTRLLANHLQALTGKAVKLTYEPHDASCGGLFIRQVLEKRISNFSHRTLALAFAANRMDHCDRDINPWLAAEPQRILLCDRYYLSSLVYQSTEDFSMAEVMRLNERARRPDLLFFMNVSNEVCYERMKIRNKPRELFERNLSETRDKYREAIAFLEAERQERIIEIDANGTIESVLAAMLRALRTSGPSWLVAQLPPELPPSPPGPSAFGLRGPDPLVVEHLLTRLRRTTTSSPGSVPVDGRAVLLAFWEKLAPTERAALFLAYLRGLGFLLKDRIPGTSLEAFELSYVLPGGPVQRGVALLVSEPQRYDLFLRSAASLGRMADFMFVFSPGPAASVTQYYERDLVQVEDRGTSLFPATQLVTEADLRAYLLARWEAGAAPDSPGTP